MKRHLDAGYTMVKMKVGGAPLAEDMQAHRGGEEHPADRMPSLRSTPTPSSTATRRCAYAKAMAPFKLRWFEEPCDPLDFATLAGDLRRLSARALDRREPVLARRTWRTWCASAA